MLIVFLSSRISPRDVDGDLPGEVAVGDGGGDLGDVADLGGEVAGHRVDGVGEVLPGTGHAVDVGLTAELAFGADLARDARDLGGEGAELLDHQVDGLRGAEELALERAIVDLERHGLRQVALGHRADHARGLAGGLHEARDQRVHVRDRIGPRAGDRPYGCALGDLAVLADGEAEPLELRGQALVHLDHFVEGVGDLARDPDPVIG